MERDKVLKVLSCMELLEEAAARFYESLSRVIQDEELAELMRFVSRESENHAKVLKSFFGEPHRDECLSVLGSKGFNILLELEEATSRIEGGWRPSQADLADLLEKLNNLEKMAGEEVYSQIITAAFSIEALGPAKLLLKAIAEEEKHHYEIVLFVSKTLRE
ncbi:MAG: ferritin family protein [Thermofilaceae archaeon]